MNRKNNKIITNNITINQINQKNENIKKNWIERNEHK